MFAQACGVRLSLIWDVAARRPPSARGASSTRFARPLSAALPAWLASLRFLRLPLASLRFLGLPLASLRFFGLPLASLRFLRLPLASLRFLRLPLASLRFVGLPLASLRFSAQFFRARADSD
jgi:hypothetical protein